MSREPLLRVVLLTTSFPLTRGARSGIFIKKMLDCLPDTVQATVLTPDSSTALEEISADRGRFTVVRFRYAPRAWQRLAHGSGGIVAALSQKQPACLLIPFFLCSAFFTCCRYALKADVLHANWSINGVIAGVAGLLTRTPVITTLRGSDVNLMEKSWLLRQLVAACLRLSTRVVTVSPSLEAVIKKQFPQYDDRITVIANGIDASFFSAGKRESISADSTPPVRLLSVGNLTSGKRVQLILEATAGLATENWLLDIVGDGPEKENLEKYCQEAGLASRVFFHGSVAPEKVPQFMARADVFVFASVAEGRPNVILEAMATRLAVVAGAIPAVEELIEDHRQGLLFPVDDSKALRRLLEGLINHPAKRQSLGAGAGKYIQSLGLSWQESAEQYAVLYGETAGKTAFFSS
jgi:glycosyltransferase involved in cell wall biosynthesis